MHRSRLPYRLRIVRGSMLSIPMFVFALAAEAPATGPRPPFRRVWSLSTGENQIENFVIDRETLYYGTSASWGAVDLATGRSLWKERKCPPGSFGAHIAVADGTLYVGVGRSRVIAADPKTGMERWSHKATPYCQGLTATKDAVYGEVSPNRLSRLDARTGREVWSVPIDTLPRKEHGKDDTALSADPVVVSGGRLVAASNTGSLFAVDAATGSTLWRNVPASGDAWGTTGMATDGSRVFSTRDSSLEAHDARTGERLWHFDARGRFSGSPVIMKAVLFAAADDGKLYALNASDGRIVWEKTLSRDIEPGMSAVSTFRSRILVSTSSQVYAFHFDGSEAWRWAMDRNLFYYPVVPLADGLLLSDAQTFLRYAEGEPEGPPPTPEQRRALAVRLMDRIEELRRDDKAALVRLGDDACDVLLPRAIQWNAELRDEHEGRGDPDKSYASYSRLMNAFEVLAVGMSRNWARAHTDQLLGLFGNAVGPEVGFFFNRIVKDGDPDQLTTWCLATLENERLDWSNTYYAPSLALTALTRSDDPRGIAFLTKALKDPKADPNIKHAAFAAVARHGGEEAVKTVLGERDTVRTLPTLEEFMALSSLGLKAGAAEPAGEHQAINPSKLLATRNAPDGTLYGLIASRALGADKDRWVVRRRNDRWTAPVFIGKRAGKNEDPQWLVHFLAYPELAADGDGDGWTDLAEGRLGTDRKNPDTDGDGIPDGRDRNPLAGRAPRSDEEKVLAAAIEARFKGVGNRDVPCVVEMPAGVEPIEFGGWKWAIIAVRAGRKSQIEAVAGEGVGRFGFRSPELDFDGGSLHPKNGDPPILWNSDRTRARIHVVAWYGGLDATGFDMELRRVGDEWLVVEMKMMWIS